MIVFSFLRFFSIKEETRRLDFLRNVSNERGHKERGERGSYGERRE